MADEKDQGSLATDTSDARDERDAAVADERGLPESASNDNPLPLEAIDTMVNKAEGDHEALAENAFQEKTVRESDSTSFNGLTSVEEQAREQQLADLHEDAPGAITGAEANTPPDASKQPESSGPDATDAARSLAAERGLDLSEVKGTGADGRITKDDVEAASA